MTQRAAILAAVVAALRGAGGPAGLFVDKYPLRPFAAGQLPSVSLYPASETVERDEFEAIVKRTLSVSLECRAKGDDVDDALDPVLAWNTLVMEADRTWGGLALDTREASIDWEGASAETDFGRALHTFEITYYTAETDQTQPAA